MSSINKGKKIIIIGIISIIALFLLYSRYQNPEVFTPSALEPIQRIALGFYITMITAIGGIGFGIYPGPSQHGAMNPEGIVAP